MGSRNGFILLLSASVLFVFIGCQRGAKSTGDVNSLYQQNQYKEAEKAAKDVVSKEPDNAEAHKQLGDVYRAAGRNQEAAQEYGEAQRLEPFYDRPKLGQAYALADRRQYAEALKVVGEIVANNPPGDSVTVEAIALRGRIYGEQGKYDDALKAYEEAYKQNPKASFVHTGLAGVYLAQKNFAKAEEESKTAISLRQDFWGYWNLGNVYFAQQRYDDARKAYEESLKYQAPQHLRNQVMQRMKQGGG